MAETVFGAAAMCLLLVLPAAVLSAGPEIFLREEPETYLVIDKLEGAGLLPGLLTGDRGFESSEVAREAEKIYSAGDPFEEEMLRFLMMGMEKRYDFRLRAGLEDAAGHPVGILVRIRRFPGDATRGKVMRIDTNGKFWDPPWGPTPETSFRKRIISSCLPPTWACTWD